MLSYRAGVLLGGLNQVRSLDEKGEWKSLCEVERVIHAWNEEEEDGERASAFQNPLLTLG